MILVELQRRFRSFSVPRDRAGHQSSASELLRRRVLRILGRYVVSLRSTVCKMIQCSILSPHSSLPTLSLLQSDRRHNHARAFVVMVFPCFAAPTPRTLASAKRY